MSKNSIFNTELINLEAIQNLGFVIPSYQRPYVWSDIEISKLLTDFYNTFCKNREREYWEEYYGGTILTKDSRNEAELIDGQQRFTTLWLIAFVFWIKKTGSDIEKFLYAPDDKNLKLCFEIRTEVANHFRWLIQSQNNPEMATLNNEKNKEHPYLKNIARALSTIKSAIDENVPNTELKDFGNYIYTKVYFIKNTTPENIDLNKLFSIINSAGVQLEQTDIVKSNLLRLIDEKVLYGKIWETCEDMNNFFERNAKISFPKTDWSKIDFSNHVSFDKNIFLYDISQQQINNDDTDAFTIDDFLISNIAEYEEGGKHNKEDKRESEEIYCRSIISFGQLLLHAYRIHLKLENKPDFEGTFHINRIIEIFSDVKDPEEIKRFIGRLWDVRLLFDKYIIKWVSDTNTKSETLELLSINKNSENNYSRSHFEISDMLMLQSVLYFTGDYLRQYWLTPYLYYLLNSHSDRNANDDVLLTHLEDIDNQLSLSRLQDKDATFKIIDGKLGRDFDFVKYLDEGKEGTKFRHYWFQKLEYVLWKNWEWGKTEEFKNFRITSKNSVEHIYPQHPENRTQHPKIQDEFLHSFGNLVLLSVSQNSEYSNKSVSVKQSMFKEKKSSYDTLKSYYVFTYPNWTPVEIGKHKEAMLRFLKSHYMNMIDGLMD